MFSDIIITLFSFTLKCELLSQFLPQCEGNCGECLSPDMVKVVVLFV